eukprot:TRINITY_DN5748_c0_g1_i3.p1 TRINITY_DN5748_c0_g1~~TRINITY_DN5748_c0_g1_i3.p1  ORF type:complete len:606 (-),score=116.86 TRINITY_DN5748_c0_g1_i3:861-2678(-)
MRAWCQTCRGYQPLLQTRRPAHLPPVLLLQCHVDSEAKLRFWHTNVPASPAVVSESHSGDMPAGSRGHRPPGGSSGTMNVLSRSPSGGGGSDQWLPFFFRIDASATSSVAVTQEMAPSAILPDLQPTPGGTAAIYELTALVATVVGDRSSASGETAALDPGGHLVAHIKVPPEYWLSGRGSSHASLLSPAAAAVDPLSPGLAYQLRSANRAAMLVRSSTSPKNWAPGTSPTDALSSPSPRSRGLAFGALGSEWLLFNDFCITPTSPQEVVTFYGKGKVPCLLVYTRVQTTDPEDTRAAEQGGGGLQQQGRMPGTGELLPVETQKAMSPISEDLFRRLIRKEQPSRFGGPDGDLLAPRTFWPLELPREQPRPGFLLGLDAEFVALSAAETGARQDGSWYVKRPARLGLARVSLVRGEGPREGVCCVDDYICPVEPVHDYLTRYSGLVEEDLDPAVSTRHLTSMKEAYLKLRYMVDLGCCFVGHGLKKDFRMINIVVPPEQVIDTVELFHLKRQRNLSLRFLASCLLQIDIQQGSHDSIEDARTALLLYTHYRELVASGEFQEKLLEIYRFGRRIGWEMAPSLDANEALPPAASPPLFLPDSTTTLR